MYWRRDRTVTGHVVSSWEERCGCLLSGDLKGPVGRTTLQGRDQKQGGTLWVCRKHVDDIL